MNRFNSLPDSTRFASRDNDSGLPHFIAAGHWCPNGALVNRFYDLSTEEFKAAPWAIDAVTGIFPFSPQEEIDGKIENAVSPTEERKQALLRGMAAGLMSLAEVLIFDEEHINNPHKHAAILARRETSSRLPSKLGQKERQIKQNKPNHVYPSIGGGVVLGQELGGEDIKFAEMYVPAEKLLSMLVGVYHMAVQFEAQKGTLRPGVCVYVLEEEPELKSFYKALGFEEDEKDRKKNGGYRYHRNPNYLEDIKDPSGETVPSQHQIRLWHPDINNLIENLKTQLFSLGYDLLEKI